MPLVLALEPDLRQAEALAPILQRIGAELVLARSRDDAVRALALRVPDLILVSALLSPPDEAEFTSYLQTLPDTAHLQTLSLPLLAQASPLQPAKRRRFGLGLDDFSQASNQIAGASCPKRPSPGPAAAHRTCSAKKSGYISNAERS